MFTCTLWCWKTKYLFYSWYLSKFFYISLKTELKWMWGKINMFKITIGHKQFESMKRNATIEWGGGVWGLCLSSVCIGFIYSVSVLSSTLECNKLLYSDFIIVCNEVASERLPKCTCAVFAQATAHRQKLLVPCLFFAFLSEQKFVVVFFFF